MMRLVRPVFVNPTQLQLVAYVPIANSSGNYAPRPVSKGVAMRYNRQRSGPVMFALYFDRIRIVDSYPYLSFFRSLV